MNKRVMQFGARNDTVTKAVSIPEQFPVRVIVHEAGRRWVDFVRDALRNHAIRVHHTATSSVCLRLIEQGGPVVIVAELGSDALATMELIASLATKGSVAAMVIVIIASRTQAEFELPLRELGAISFLVEPIAPREVADLVSSIARELQQLTTTL